jgi:hypothetical protein
MEREAEADFAQRAVTEYAERAHALNSLDELAEAPDAED